MPAPRGDAQSTSWDAVSRFGDAYATFVAQGWRRSWEVGSGYLGRAAAVAVQAATARSLDEDLIRMVLEGWRNYAVEMAGVPLLALEEARTTWEREATLPHDGRAEKLLYEVHNKPVMLPVRFGAASQGWALYFVDPVKAQAHLGQYGDAFEIYQVAGRAMLVIYVVDFRETDLGPYREVGVEFWVRPKGARSVMPGTVVVRMSVDETFSVDAASALWKFDKLLAPHMKPHYDPRSATFAVDARDANTLAITLPRFGAGRSTEVPIRYFTTETVGAPPRKRVLCTVFHRSAVGEGVQFGGDVGVRLGDGEGDNCFCALAHGKRICTCEALRDLGLPGARPVANGWTDHMSGHVDPAYPVTPE